MFITFIALLINRVPAVRQRITDVADEVRAKEEFVRNWLRQSGKAVAESPAETINNTWLVENILRSVQTLVPHLAQRKWSLWFAENDAPDLICSDNPVALAWMTGGSGSWPPGFEHWRTQVSCPLSRRVLLVGSFEGQPHDAPLDALAVATANSCARRNANQLYSATEDFVWLTQDAQIGTKADLVQALSTARK